jgi:uncharacterized protein (DUF58 family)
VISRLSSLPLVARQPMLGNVSGRHVSPHRGSSIEFAEYRKYVPGDDLRRLDWRAYGRTDRFYVKEFEADTNLRCCLILDTSGSMAYQSNGLSKLDYAKRVAATIGYLAMLQGDAVGLSCVADGLVTSISPKRNPSHLRTIFDLMEKAEPQGPTRLVDVLHELAETIKQRALVVMVSDFFTNPELLKECFEHFRFRKHDLAAFHLLDPQEINFRFDRPTRFVDLEGGEMIFAEPSAIEARYREAVQRYLRETADVMRDTGVDYYRVSTDAPYENRLAEFLIRRSGGGKR